MNRNAALEALARDLARARVDGHAIAAPTRIPTLDEAYAVAARAAALMNSPRVGYKVGSTSAEAQARLGTDEPGAGAVLARFCFGDGASVPVSPHHDAQVEVEFALRVGQRIEPRRAPWQAAEVAGHIDAVIPAMEIVGSRFDRGLAGAGRALVTADGGANIALVLGTPVPAEDLARLAEHRCALRIDGEEQASGTGARALGNPLNVMVWLVNHLGKSGIALEAGEVVSTGTCTGLVAVRAGQRLECDFGALGCVSCMLVLPADA